MWVIIITGLNAIFTFDDGLKGFDQAISRQRRKSARTFGKFNNPPKLADLRSMKLEKSEIEHLRQCTIGSCELRLSAAMIQRIRTEIDWTAADYKTKVNRLYRQMLVDYVTDYLERGNEALIEYQHRRVAISLNDELRSLHHELIWINDFAPEFSRYLENFPNIELSNVKNSVRWSKVKIAFKPVIIITHISTYTKKENGISQILIISKQIYANHHFDSSLGLTALVNFQEGDRARNAYVLYTNRSRASALGGAIGRLVRSVVETAAIDKLQIVLKDTKRYAESPSTAQNDPQLQEHVGFLERLQGLMFPILSLLAVIVFAGLILLSMRRLDRGKRGIEKDN